MRNWTLFGIGLALAVGCSSSDDNGGSGDNTSGSGGETTLGGTAGSRSSGGSGGRATGGTTGGSLSEAGSATGGKATGGSPIASGGAEGGSTGGIAAGADAGGESGAPDGEGGAAPSGGMGSAGAPGDGPWAFVAVGWGGRRTRSLDAGKTWTDEVSDIPNGGDDPYLLRAVAYGNGQFVAAGLRIHTSPDGGEWTSHAPMGQWLGGLAYAKNKWVAAGGYGLRAVSQDGVSYEPNQGDEITTAFRALAYEDVAGRWIAVGGRLRLSSSNGTSWEEGSGDPIQAGFNWIAAGGGLAVAVGGSSVTVSRDGGLSWDAPEMLGGELSGAAWAGDRLVVVGRDAVHVSEDGSDWTKRTVTGLEGKIGCRGELCTVVSRKGAWVSDDAGESWTRGQTFEADAQEIEAVTWGPIP